jgi:hypothetical protein
LPVEPPTARRSKNIRTSRDSDDDSILWADDHDVVVHLFGGMIKLSMS